jgi:hypothetical protein
VLAAWPLGPPEPAGPPVRFITPIGTSPAPPALLPVTTAAARATSTITAAPRTTTQAIQHNCEEDGPEEGDRVQAADDIIFQPAAMVPRGTYGQVISVQSAVLSQDVSVTFDGFPDLRNASVSMGQITQAVQPGDRVKAANELGGTAGDPSVPRDAIGTVAEVLLPGSDGWEVHYHVTWDFHAQDSEARVRRDQIYKVDVWSPQKTRWCCAHRNVSCPENCATEEAWSDAKRKWCCVHHGLGCGSTSTVSDSTTTRTGSSTTTRVPYNCYMQEDWTDEKQEWCCTTERLGCKSAETDVSQALRAGRMTVLR